MLICFGHIIIIIYSGRYFIFVTIESLNNWNIFTPDNF